MVDSMYDRISSWEEELKVEEGKYGLNEVFALRVRRPGKRGKMFKG